MKCKYCGFDDDNDSIYAEGAPCVFNGCTIFVCCMQAYDDHVKLYHVNEQVKNENGN